MNIYFFYDENVRNSEAFVNIKMQVFIKINVCGDIQV